MLSMYPACFFMKKMGIECLAGYLHACQMDGDNTPQNGVRQMLMKPKEMIRLLENNGFIY